MASRNHPSAIIVHESVSPYGDRMTINGWHIERGFKEIGYHYGIGNAYPTQASWRLKQAHPEHDGLLFAGRDIDKDGDIDEEIGAHCPGYNSTSLGVCLIGEKGQFTPKQMESLYGFLTAKCREWDIKPERILGHCETPSGKRQGKACPELPMDEVRAEVRRRLAADDAAGACLM